MITKKLNGHIICYSSFKFNISSELNEYISSLDFKNICSNLIHKTIIVLGGDGTMLRAIKHHHDLGLFFLGINFGNKGFLLNSKKYINGCSKYDKVEYPIMQANIDIGNEKYSDIFINELNITAGGGKMLDLNINLSNRNNINIKGDGILICTPTGSTGYNSSLRGPIIPHAIPVLVITSKAPWFPRGQHPIIIPDSEEIIVTRNGRQSTIECYSDSRELYKGNDENIKISVIKLQNTISFLIDKKYKQIWDNKILIEQGFN